MLKKIRWLLVFLLAFILSALLSLSVAHGNELDSIIKDSAKVWLPGVDWRIWRAQIQAESNFNCAVTSPVGAMGCAQIMPATMLDIERSSGISGSAYTPEIGIFAGAWYMARMRRVFKAPRPEKEKHNLAMASYNAGAGNIIKAQKLANEPENWQPVADVLHKVTGKHSKETINYVEKINTTYHNYILRGL